MNEADQGVEPTNSNIEEVRKHLLHAQMLVDAIDPSSIIGARLEQLITALEEER